MGQAAPIADIADQTELSELCAAFSSAVITAQNHMLWHAWDDKSGQTRHVGLIFCRMMKAYLDFPAKSIESDRSQ